MTRFAILTVVVLFVLPLQANAQSSGFSMSVPGIIGINAKNDLAEITHDESENDQQFPWQRWTVRNLNGNGAFVTFSTTQAFRHNTNPNSKRNARLILRKQSGRRWSIATRRDKTNYQSGDEVATVSAESNRAGSATFRLGVDFVEESFSTLQAGEYTTTVVGTITPK